MFRRGKKFDKRRSAFFKESAFLRWMIAVIATILLAIFLHFREVRIDLLEIDQPAKNYMVAQIDFEFPDSDATVVLKQEALRDIGRIYKIHDAEIKRVRQRFETYLVNHPNWRNDNPATFEEIYNGLDALVAVLSKANLTDERTFKKREELDLSTDNYFIVPPLDSEEGNLFPKSFWEKVEGVLLDTYKLQPTTALFILDFFRVEKWRVYNDIDAQRLFRNRIEHQVPEKYTKVPAGTRIIAQGERVTTRHMMMLNAMKKALQTADNRWTFHTILGSLLFAVLITTLVGFYLWQRQREVFTSVRSLSLYVTILCLVLFFAKLFEYFLLHTGSAWFEFVRYPIFIPFATIMLSLLLNTEISLFSSFLLTIVADLSLSFDHVHFLMINALTAATALLVVKKLKKRKEVFVVSCKIGFSAFLVIVIYNFSNYTIFSSAFLIDILALIVNLFFISLLLISFMPILESLFNVMTDMTLMEYMDPQNELLKRLSLEAPGTYQHSLSIGHIAEYVANAIGANGLFCRVTTLYHDAGKLNTPQYYTENQMISGGKTFNIHQLLTPVESAYIIKSHIPDGVSLARQYRLPEPFIDIIEQHHGTTLIKFFYAKQCQEMKDHPDDIDEAAFRYPGPKPQTKEAAIIMMADSTEAASRSLEENSEENIRNMVDRVVSDKINDGQFAECPLTFQELYTVKQKLVEIIKATHHLRIKYPEPIKKIK
ncbi:MAG: HDIG domain-containing protein [Verrucomicrobia bacterium]|nr:HDIG domain-containing protein [Verrucomicrobiota bacterium]